jgi:hypothetical protein
MEGFCFICQSWGKPMRRGTAVLGPDEFVVLEQICDAIWRHLERIGRVHPDEHTVRQWISARVIACAKDGDLLDMDEIKKSVLKSLHQ